MTKSPVEVMAIDALLGLSPEERIIFAKDVLLHIEDANLIHKLEQAANEVGRHAHELQRKHMPLRTDDFATQPYASGGRSLGKRHYEF